MEVDDGYIVFGAMNQDSALIKVDKTVGNVIFSKNFDFVVNIRASVVKYHLTTDAS